MTHDANQTRPVIMAQTVRCQHVAHSLTWQTSNLSPEALKTARLGTLSEQDNACSNRMSGAYHRGTNRVKAQGSRKA